MDDPLFTKTKIDKYISQCYTEADMQQFDIVQCKMGAERAVNAVDVHIRKVYVPMTETSFYILLCLREESHGYNIIRKVEKLTDGEIRISPGTMYGSLSKMEKDGLIRFVREEEKRKIYRITDLGKDVLALEMKRIERLYRNMMEVR